MLSLSAPALVLGGHSFIQQLGVGPRPEEGAAAEIVAECVRRLGVWHPGNTVSPGVYEVAISPGNIADNGGDRFLGYRSNGWEALATSPFVRGWLLERLANRSGRPIEEIADLLLRYAAFLPGMDRLVVSIRQPALVGTNVASWRRGPLSAEETGQLQDLFLRFGAS